MKYSYGKSHRKNRILIVDDSDSHRGLFKEILENDYDVVEVKSGTEAILYLQEHGEEVSLVLLDVQMSDMDGCDVLIAMNHNQWTDHIPVIMISEVKSPEEVRRAFDYGVTDFISQPYDMHVVRQRVANTIMLYMKQRKLEKTLLEQIREQERSNDLMVNILSHIVEFRNGESGIHVLHISKMTEILLEKLDEMREDISLTRSEAAMISTAAALHDIGKISIPEDILNKTGRFTPEEFEIMKQHTVAGESMLKNMGFYENEPLVKAACEICRWHHERFDGNGYPDGLKGKEIPLAAQVVALADVYDALTSERCYKKAIPHKTAIEMIVRGECGSFDPVLLRCLQETADVLQEELKTNLPDFMDEEELQRVVKELLKRQDL